MSGRRKGETTDKATARDIVRGVMEEIIGPFVQTHRATSERKEA